VELKSRDEYLSIIESALRQLLGTKENYQNRIYLAGLIRDNARNIQDVFPSEILSLLHAALFDQCDDVRLFLVQALFYGGNHRSAHFLQQLMGEVQVSRFLRKYACKARNRCLMRDDSMHPKDRIVMLVSKNADLAAAVLEVTEREGGKFVKPEPSYSELIAWSSTIKIVDRWLLGKDVWDIFCSYLDDVNETETAFPLRDEDGSILMEEPIFDYSPLVIIDSRLKKAKRVFKEPNKPKDKIFYIESKGAMLKYAVTYYVELALRGEI